MRPLRYDGVDRFDGSAMLDLALGGALVGLREAFPQPNERVVAKLETEKLVEVVQRGGGVGLERASSPSARTPRRSTASSRTSARRRPSWRRPRRPRRRRARRRRAARGSRHGSGRAPSTGRRGRANGYQAAPTAEAGTDRARQQVEDVTERPVLHVEQIEPDRLVARDVGAPRHLPHAGEAGRDAQPPHVPRHGRSRDLARQGRARPDHEGSSPLSSDTLRCEGPP
jgi:hypothetical protein